MSHPLTFPSILSPRNRQQPRTHTHTVICWIWIFITNHSIKIGSSTAVVLKQGQRAAIILPFGPSLPTDPDSEVWILNIGTSAAFRTKISVFEQGSLNSGHLEKMEFDVIETGCVRVNAQKTGGRKPPKFVDVAKVKFGGMNVWIALNKKVVSIAENISHLTSVEDDASSSKPQVAPFAQQETIPTTSSSLRWI